MIKPLFNRVLIKAKEAEEVRASGIVLPRNSRQERPQQGTVLAVGELCTCVKEKDSVIFKTYSPTEVNLEDSEYLILEETDILGII